MTAVTAMLETGWITALAAGLLMVELLAIWLWPRRSVSMRLFWFNGVAGLALIGAVHAALIGAGGFAVMTLLALAFVSHFADLAARLR